MGENDPNPPGCGCPYGRFGNHAPDCPAHVDNLAASVGACAGCGIRQAWDSTSVFAQSGDKAFCPACCPQLYCEACLAATGGQCREHQEPECTCYELAGANGGHQPGCPFYGQRPIVGTEAFGIEFAGVRIDPKDAVEEAAYTFTIRHPPLVTRMAGEQTITMGPTVDTVLEEVERIYHRIDEMMRAGDFEGVADAIDRVDMEQPTIILLAYASITSVAASILGPHRTKYMARVRARLTETEPSRVGELLSGLE